MVKVSIPLLDQGPIYGFSAIRCIDALFQQMIYRDGDASSQKGLTVWAETAIAPKSTVNTMPYFVARTTAETVIEANYQIILKRWLSITPDLQYIMRPSGSSAIGDALVLGAQVAISF